MKALHERVAGIGVQGGMIKVAGEKAWTRQAEILEFRTYGVLQAMDAELRRPGVTHVVMEASGVIRGAKALGRTLPRSCRCGRRRSHGAGCDQGKEDGVDDLLEGVVVGGGEGGEDFVA